MNLKLFAIRHKATGKLMPLIKRGRGYSHWNPSREHTLDRATILDVPRLFSSEKQAKGVIRAWAAMPNAEYRGRMTADGEDDYDICFTEDGRTKDDLEVFELILWHHNPDDLIEL